MSEREIEMAPTTVRYVSPEGTTIPNPELLSRQIDGLREVLQRMKTPRLKGLTSAAREIVERATEH